LTLSFDGSRQRFGHKLWMVGSSHIKTEIYSNLRLAAPLDGEAFPQNYIHIPQVDDEFLKSLTAEALVKTKKGYEWVKQRPRNEVLDTFVYARAAASMYGIDRFSEFEWEQIEGISEKPLSLQNQPASKSTNAISNKPNPLWKNPGLKKRF